MNSKVARTRTSDEDQDRLSSIPDCVLCHILSFLPTKYAAITSVLSTRWRSLFLGVQNIDLDYSLLLKPPQEEKHGSTRTDHDNRDFINFVNRRIMLCKKSSITEFRLKYRYRSSSEAAAINLWLEILPALRNVKVVEIEFVQSSDTNSPPLCLPSGIFWSKTLSVLKLCGRNIVLRVPEVVCIPNLKVLNLKDLVLQFEYKNLRLDQGYPVLEDLSLDGIRFPKAKKNEVNVEISLPTLKKLAIIGVECELSRIDIDTPNLQHLVCTFAGPDEPKMQINLHKCESLVSAALSISLPSLFKLQLPGGRSLVKFVQTLNNVKELQLSGGFSIIFCHTSPSLPQLPNLTHLEFTETKASVWNLLRRTPKLTSLVCQTIQFLTLTPGQEASKVLAQSLREIQIRDFGESRDELEVVRFLLQQGAVLERMIIERPSCKKAEWSSYTWKKLLELERRSPRCRIEII